MSSSSEPPPSSSDTRTPIGREAALNLEGVFWVRFLDWGVQRCPFFIEPLLVAVYASIFFLLARRPRRAVVANLEVIAPSSGWFGRRIGAMRVFWDFAWIMVDSARARHGERHVTWRLDGAESLRAAVTRGA